MKIECDPQLCDVSLEIGFYELLWRSNAKVHIPVSGSAIRPLALLLGFIPPLC